MRTSIRLTLAALAITAGLAGPVLAPAAQAQPAYAPVPALRVEVIPPRPGPAYVWQPGYWRWTGTRYIWIGGRYAVRPAHYSAWVPAHWGHRGGGWVWIPGHWR